MRIYSFSLVLFFGFIGYRCVWNLHKVHGDGIVDGIENGRAMMPFLRPPQDSFRYFSIDVARSFIVIKIK